jgi:AbrB family looped-hinge helix DNA binding protein
MARARVSSKYRIVIPKEIRAQVDVRPGQEFEFVAKSGVIMMVPDRPIAAMRGFVRAIRIAGFREKIDRF